MIIGQCNCEIIFSSSPYVRPSILTQHSQMNFLHCSLSTTTLFVSVTLLPSHFLVKCHPHTLLFFFFLSYPLSLLSVITLSLTDDVYATKVSQLAGFDFILPVLFQFTLFNNSLFLSSSMASLEYFCSTSPQRSICLFCFSFLLN